MEVIRQLWFCVDCTLYACNGDLSGRDDARAKQVEAGAAELPEHVVPDFDAETGEGHYEFAHFSCDSCGSQLSGEYHRFAVLG